jgi:hypothetical protein
VITGDGSLCVPDARGLVWYQLHPAPERILSPYRFLFGAALAKRTQCDGGSAEPSATTFRPSTEQIARRVAAQLSPPRGEARSTLRGA